MASSAGARSADPPPPAANPRRLARLRGRAARLFPMRDVEIPLPGMRGPLRIALPADPDAPLDQLADRLAAERLAAERLAAEPWRHGETHPPPADTTPSAASEARQSINRGAHLPYWALLWPSGVALAEAIRAHPEAVRGRRALELGCGLGVTAAAALAEGADLWTADCFGEALLYCQYNALRNAGRAPHPLLLSWRTASGRAACLKLAPFDLVLAADVLYEVEDVEPLLALVPPLVGPGGHFWLAEPGRRVSAAFVRAAAARGWGDRPTVHDRAWPPDGKRVCVTVHRYTLPG